MQKSNLYYISSFEDLIEADYKLGKNKTLVMIGSRIESGKVIEFMFAEVKNTNNFPFRDVLDHCCKELIDKKDDTR